MLVKYTDGRADKILYDTVYVNGKGTGYIDIIGVSNTPFPTGGGFKFTILQKSTTITIQTGTFNSFIDYLLNY